MDFTQLRNLNLNIAIDSLFPHWLELSVYNKTLPYKVKYYNKFKPLTVETKDNINYLPVQSSLIGFYPDVTELSHLLNA